MTKGIAIVSGGMDSVTMAHWLQQYGYDLHLISFDYGQRHVKELQFAEECARDLGVQWDLIDVTGVGKFLTGSALTDDVVVPDGHYTWDTMKQTVVPNRNMIMLSIATGIAVAEECQLVATAVHTGDHRIYPDCRPAFIASINETAQIATEEFSEPDFEIWAPFVTISKAGIAQLGANLGVDWLKTWSCYKGGEIHCGTCGTCYERREAMKLAGIDDPTPYINNTEVYEEQA